MTLIVRPLEQTVPLGRVWIAGEVLDANARPLAGDTVGVWLQD